MMRHAPPAYALAEKLAILGFPLRAEHVPALLSWSAVIGAALIGGWFGLARLRAERKSLSLPELFARIDAQDVQISRLRSEIGEALTENRALKAENGDLKDKVRDRDELLEDYAQYVIHTDRHAAIGYAPPPPTKTWRMLDHLDGHHPPTGATPTHPGA